MSDTRPKSTGEKAVALLRRFVEEYIGEDFVRQDYGGYYTCTFCHAKAPIIHSAEGIVHAPDCLIDNAVKVLAEP